MNINEVVFARKIPGKRYFASNFSTWPGILLLLVVSTWQKHQYQGEKCARHGINNDIGVCEVLLASETVIGRCYWPAPALK